MCIRDRKQVETSQIFDVETVSEIAPHLDRSKQVKAEFDTSAVAEVDFAAVLGVILFQSPDLLKRVYKCRWSAANRTHRRYEMYGRNA